MKPTIIQTRLAAPASEFDAEFVQLMANRMAVSYHKYGPRAEADIDCLASAALHMKAYQKDGNPEHYVDAANYLMMAFGKERAAFRPTDSDESPGRARLDGSVDQKRNGVNR